MTDAQKQTLEEAVTRLEQEAANAVSAMAGMADDRAELEQHRVNDGALADLVTRVNAVADSLAS